MTILLLLFQIAPVGEVRSFGWGEIAAIFGIITAVSAGANAWLRVQMRTYIDESTERVLTQIRTDYPLKEVTDLKLTDLQRRVLLLEAESRTALRIHPKDPG